jgi:phosphatidylglycerophosphate synthase
VPAGAHHAPCTACGRGAQLTNAEGQENQYRACASGPFVCRMTNLQTLRRSIGARVSEPMVSVLKRCPVSPNVVTVAGLAITFVAAWFAFDGRFLTAGLVLAGASLFDMLDGALARATGKSTQFGAILDSVCDRIGEGAIIGGITLWFASTGNTIGVLVSLVALVSSFLVSYTRARGEGVGIQCTVGLCTRPERAIVLTLGLLIGWVLAAVSIVAACASVTVLQRLIYLQRKGKESGN